ncbi:hypothetical protein KY289_035652 [Solanum tuberosum]|nr:hypothetical protein KY289_035652 [Solanum tuberosum]
MSLRPSWPPPGRREGVRGKGRTNSGRGGNILVQHRNKQLISANSSSSTSGISGIDINHPMYKEFMDFMKSKKESDNDPPTYSTILIDDENIEVFDLNDKREVVLLLENSDLIWKDEPWQILAPEEWGMNPMKEMHYIHPEQKVANQDGKVHGQEILDSINEKISSYYDIATSEPHMADDISPFKKITRKLQMKKGLISKSEVIALYMEEVKKDLLRNLDIEIKDDISMVSANKTHDDDDDNCMAGEGQDADSNEGIDIEALLRNYQQQIEESSSINTAVKGKNKE